jgi:acyl-CoA synthetase (AMP-forming)/AMP-acid ligase II
MTSVVLDTMLYTRPAFTIAVTLRSRLLVTSNCLVSRTKWQFKTLSTTVSGQSDAENNPLHHDVSERCNVNVVHSTYDSIPEGPYPPLYEFVTQKWGTIQVADQKVSIIDGSTGIQRTFGDHYRTLTGLAQALGDTFNIHEGDTVALFSPNHVDYLPITLAVALRGAKLTPVNPLYTAVELSKVIEASGASVLIVHTSCLPVALQFVNNKTAVRSVIVMNDDDGTIVPEGTTDLAALRVPQKLATDSEYTHRTLRARYADNASHPVVLPYSSGTTGQPKGVCLTHQNIISNLLQLEVAECIKTVFPPHHKLITPLPFFHIYAFTAGMLYTGWQGHTVITMSQRFDLERFCQLVETHRPERAHLVPPIILGLAKSPLVDKYDLSSLKMCLSAAAPLGTQLADSLHKRLGLRVKQAWGTGRCICSVDSANLGTNLFLPLLVLQECRS